MTNTTPASIEIDILFNGEIIPVKVIEAPFMLKYVIDGVTYRAKNSYEACEKASKKSNPSWFDITSNLSLERDLEILEESLIKSNSVFFTLEDKKRVDRIKLFYGI